MAAHERILTEARRPFTTQIVARGGLAVLTLAGNTTLTRRSSQRLKLDPGGASRNVTLPALEDGLFFSIINTADAAENLVVKNAAAATIATLGMNEGAEFWCDGTAWYAFSRSTQNGNSEGVVLVASGTIATAAVKTLFATPVTVIAAPGAGLYIDVIDCHWMLDFATVAYDAAAAGDALGLNYTDAAGATTVDLVAGNAIGAAAVDYHALVRAVPEIIPVANAAIVASLDGGEWFAAAGDSPLKYEIRYRIRTLQL